MNNKQKSLLELELYWCQRMTHFVENNEIQNVDALYGEFVVDEYEPFFSKEDDWEDEWVFIPYHKTINKGKRKQK